MADPTRARKPFLVGVCRNKSCLVCVCVDSWANDSSNCSKRLTSSRSSNKSFTDWTQVISLLNSYLTHLL